MPNVTCSTWADGAEGESMSSDVREIFKVDVKSHFRQAWHSVFYVSGLFLLPLFFHHRFGGEAMQFAWTFASIIFVLVFVPHVALHLRYWMIDKGKQVHFLSRPNRLMIHENGASTEVLFKDIKSLEQVVPRAQKSSAWLFPWDSYSYAILQRKDGHRTLITSLLVPRLEWAFRMPDTTISGTLFAWPARRDGSG